MNRLSKLLLASTCLTAINASPAGAFSETEPNGTLATANLPPVGTTQITGSIPSNSVEDLDFFQLSGLQPGAAFSVSGARQNLGGNFEGGFSVENSAGTLIVGGLFGLNSAGTAVTGNVPSNGILVLEVAATQTASEGGLPDPYTLNITAPLAPTVPEPSTLSLLASGVAGLGALRHFWRKRRSS